MGRLGERDPRAVVELLARPRRRARARAGRALDPLRDRRRARLDVLRRAARALRASSPRPLAREHPELLVHAANSAATLREPGVPLRHGALRVAIYGLDPFGDDPAARGLEPALELRSYVADVKRFERRRQRRLRAHAGGAAADTWVGVLPIGYGDGVRRALTNNGEVLVGGRRHPLVGHGLDGQRHDRPRARDRRRAGCRAVLIGAQGDERILAEELAAAAGDDQLRDHLRDLAAGAARATCAVSAGDSPSACAARRAVAAAPRGARRTRRRLDRRRRGPRRAARARGRSTSTSRSPATSARRRRRSRARPAGHAFELSAEFGTWRALAAGRRLARRRQPPARRVDRGRPRRSATSPSTRSRSRSRPGGDADRPARRARATSSERLLRAVSERSFADDPLRILRAARLAAELGLRDRAGDACAWRASAAARAPASRPASASSPSCACCSPGPTRCAGSSCSTSSARPRAVLPELEALRGVEQNPNHHLDVHGHTLEVLAQLLEVEARPRALRRRRARRSCAALLAEPLADELTRGEALRFGALLHDVGKPATRERARGGFVSFIGHDRDGRGSSREVCARLRASRALRRHLEALTLHHLRLGFLVRERPLSRAAPSTSTCARPSRSPADVTLLTVADRLSARGSGPTASAGDGRGPPRAGARDARRGARLAPRRPAARRRSPATSSRPSSASSRAPSSGGCSARSRRRVFAGEVRTARRRGRARARCATDRLPRRWRTRTASSAGSSPATFPAQIVDSDEHTVAFMDINPATRGHALVVPRGHSRRPDGDLRRGPRARRSLAARRLAERMDETLRARRLQRPQRLPRRRLADGLPLPPARHPALRRRPAEAAVDPAPRRPGRDRGGRRRRISGRRLDGRADDHARARRQRRRQWCSPTRR